MSPEHIVEEVGDTQDSQEPIEPLHVARVHVPALEPPDVVLAETAADEVGEADEGGVEEVANGERHEGEGSGEGSHSDWCFCVEEIHETD